ncbi:MAG: ABC transporter permease subunit [Actinobacteria bacterium]|nr:ABC transporter permease subunit [Actinomycetota bacterium]
MIAWSFRRLRFEMLALAGALVGVGVLALITGRAMSHTYHSSGLAECLAQRASGADCADLLDQFDRQFGGLQILIIPLVLLPVVLGAFIGSPLVAREVEAGTHRFFWTQGITRSRWLGSSAGAVVATAAGAGALYSLIALAWLDVTNRVSGDRFSSLYDFQGVIPIAATVLAAALGVLAGAVLRRTVPAMAATFAAFIAIRLPLALFVRPHLATPVTASLPFGDDDLLEGTDAWVLSNVTVDATGRVLGRDGSLDVSGIIGRCPSLPRDTSGFPAREAVDACLRELGVRSVVKYQPGNRFWTFQLIESGMLLGVAAVALALAFVAVRRRIT